MNSYYSILSPKQFSYIEVRFDGFKVMFWAQVRALYIFCCFIKPRNDFFKFLYTE